MRKSAMACVLLFLSAVVLSGCSSSGYNWGWYIVSPFDARGSSNIQFLLSGFGFTIAVALCAITISVVLGLLVALPGLSNNKLLRAASRTYVEALRAVPMLVMVLWVYYGVPVLLDVRLGVFIAGVIALALCDSAFE